MSSSEMPSTKADGDAGRQTQIAGLRAARRQLEQRLEQLLSDGPPPLPCGDDASDAGDCVDASVKASVRHGEASAAVTRARLLSSARHAASAASIAMAEVRLHLERAIDELRRRAGGGTRDAKDSGDEDGEGLSGAPSALSESSRAADSLVTPHKTEGTSSESDGERPGGALGPLQGSGIEKPPLPQDSPAPKQATGMEVNVSAGDTEESSAMTRAMGEARMAASDAMAAMVSARRAAAGLGKSLGAVAGEAARRLRRAALEEAFGTDAVASTAGSGDPAADRLLQSAVSATEEDDDGMFAPLSDPASYAHETSLLEVAIASAFTRMQRAADPQAGYIARELRLATGGEAARFRGSGRHDEPPRSVKERSQLPGAAGLLHELESDPITPVVLRQPISDIQRLEQEPSGGAAAADLLGRAGEGESSPVSSPGGQDLAEDQAEAGDTDSETGEDYEDDEDEEDDDEDEEEGDGAWWPFNRDGPMGGVHARVVQGIEGIRSRMTPRLGPQGSTALEHGEGSHGKGVQPEGASDLGFAEMAEQLRDLVVVKMVPVGDVNEATVAAEEARELRRLEHRHVVRSYDDFLHFESRSTLISRLLGSKLGRGIDRFGQRLRLLPTEASSAGLEAKIKALAEEARVQGGANAGHFRSEEALTTEEGSDGGSTLGKSVTADASGTEGVYGGLQDVQLYVCIVMEYCPVAADALVRYAREPRRRLALGSGTSGGDSAGQATGGGGSGTTGEGLEVRPLPERRVARLLREAALGLAYSHSKQCLHRDIKLENLFFGQDGKVRVGDFGLAKRLQRGPVTRLSQAGTAPYKAPEVLLGQPRDGRAADVFALGMCAHELLTLCFVWETWPPAEVVEQEKKRYAGGNSAGVGGEGGGDPDPSQPELGEMDGTLAARLLHQPKEALEEFVGRIARRWAGHQPGSGAEAFPSGGKEDMPTGQGATVSNTARQDRDPQAAGPYSHRLLRLVTAMLDPQPQRRPSADEVARRLLTIERAAAGSGQR